MSNGYGYIPPGNMGGDSYMNTAGPGPVYETPSPPPVYSDTSPTIYSTDTPALIPTTPQQPVYSDPVIFDWNAPLNFDNLNFSDPAIPTLASMDVDYGPTMTGATAGLPSIEFYQDTTAEQWVIPQSAPGYGPIEWLVDTGKGALDLIWDTGKFILEHLDVGISYAGDIGQQVSSRKYYEALGEAQKTAAEAAKIKAQAYAAAVKAGTMTQGEADARMAADKSPVFLTTPQAQVSSPNYLLYAAIGIAAYYFLR